MDIMTEQGRAARNDYQRQYRKQHQDKERAYQKEWRQSHPDKIREYNSRYWDRVAQKSDETLNRNSVTTNVTNSVTDQVSVTNQKICQECGKVFTAKRSTARFCSAVCRVNYNRNTKSSQNGY
jgi:formylmethanofuran dehydrogenase subunit E